MSNWLAYCKTSGDFDPETPSGFFVPETPPASPYRTERQEEDTHGLPPQQFLQESPHMSQIPGSQMWPGWKDAFNFGPNTFEQEEMYECNSNGDRVDSQASEENGGLEHWNKRTPTRAVQKEESEDESDKPTNGVANEVSGEAVAGESSDERLHSDGEATEDESDKPTNGAANEASGEAVAEESFDETLQGDGAVTEDEPANNTRRPQPITRPPAGTPWKPLPDSEFDNLQWPEFVEEDKCQEKCLKRTVDGVETLLNKNPALSRFNFQDKPQAHEKERAYTSAKKPRFSPQAAIRVQDRVGAVLAAATTSNMGYMAKLEAHTRSNDHTRLLAEQARIPLQSLQRYLEHILDPATEHPGAQQYVHARLSACFGKGNGGFSVSFIQNRVEEAKMSTDALASRAGLPRETIQAYTGQV